MSSLSNIDKVKLESLFDMGNGYVLDFSDRRFYDFVVGATGKNILDNAYSVSGTSKAKRLRIFWEKESDSIVGKLTEEMIEYWKTKRNINRQDILPRESELHKECERIVLRLLKRTPNSEGNSVTEAEFIGREFKTLALDNLNIDSVILQVVRQRVDEIRKCLTVNAPLSVIFLCGSTLEGILLAIAVKNPQIFNSAKSAPQREGKVLQFRDWSLANLIDVSHELRYIQEDVKKYSHSLRGFRNYIHPHEQTANNFFPNEHTAKISWQVLQAAIFEITTKGT